MSLLILTSLRTRLIIVIIGLLLVAGAASFALWSRTAALRVEACAQRVVAPGGLPTLRGEAAVEQLKQQGLYASLGEAVARTRYDLHRWEGKDLPARLKLDGEVWHAANPAQGLNAYFSRGSVKVVGSGDGKPGWELGLRVTGYGYGQQTLAVGAGEMKAEGNRVEYTRPVISTDPAIRNPQSTLKEWYVNNYEGVEQGFTLNAAPGAKPEGEALRVRMELADGWQANIADGGQAVKLVGQRGGQLRYAKLAAWDANKKPLRAWMEVEGREVRLAVDDANTVYPITIDPTFSQQQKLTASDGAAGDDFGFSVAISGDTTVIGAPLDDVGTIDTQGSAYVFVRSGTTWTQQQRLIASDGESVDGFGSSVAISGETVVIGALGDNIGANNEQGSAYVFVRSGTTWAQQAKLTASDGESADGFGWSVAVSGATVVIGAVGDNIGANDDQGSAYVYVRSGTTWGQQAKLIANNGVAVASFGVSVAVSGETVIVGAHQDEVGANDIQGSVYVFVRSGTTWTQQAKLTASDGEEGDFFGVSVAMSGETVVVGAPNKNTGVGVVNLGAAYVFVRSGMTWAQQQRLTSDATFGAAFGQSVSVSGETVAVGAPADTIGENYRQGSVYIFACNNCSDFTITKSDGDAIATPGSPVIYTLSYANVRMAEATGVMLTETVPANTTFNAAASSPGWACTPNGNAGASCTLNIGSLAIGASGMKAFAVTVDNTVPTGINQIANTASIADDGTHGPGPSTATASDTTPLNINRSPVANNDSYSTNAGTALTVAAPGVLGNDTDADGNTLTAVLVSGPASGALTLNANGSFTYTPAANFSGSVSFTYKANDGVGDSNNATVTITVRPGKTTPIITWQNPANITYGTALSATQLNATANVAGSFSYTPAIGTILNAGNGQTLTANFTPTDTNNYTTASRQVTINVLKAPLTVKVNSAFRNQGEANPPFSGSITGLKPGDVITASYSTTATIGSAPGSYPITATLNDPGNRLGNYQVTNTPGTLTILNNSCGISITPTTLLQPALALPYAQAFSASPYAAYSFSLYASSLPPGLQLVNSFGVYLLQGTPTLSGTYTFTIRAQRTGSTCESFRTYTMTIAPTVVPKVTCVTPNANGSYTVRFGYDNSTGVAVTIPVSANNYFIPGAQNRGQTTTFQLGVVNNAFSVTFANAGAFAGWSLKGPDGGLRIVVPSVLAPRCP